MADPNCTCTQTEHVEERQALYDLLMMGCKQLDACPMCALSAALYAAAQAAHKGTGHSESAFLDAAKEIYQDVGKQHAGELVS